MEQFLDDGNNNPVTGNKIQNLVTKEMNDMDQMRELEKGGF